VSASAIVALAAALLAGGAAALALLTLRRAQRRARSLEEEIERGRAQFAEVVAREADLQSTSLAETLALARSEVLSVLAGEERRIIEERRREVALRERDAGAKLTTALAEAQRSVEQRFAEVHGGFGGQRLAVLGMGKLGSREMSATSDLDLIFVYDIPSGLEASDGAQPLVFRS